MNIASTIDHTLLKPDCTLEAIQQLCAEAKENQFAAVCVPPFFVKAAAEYLKETSVQIATVVGFPLGYNTTEVKVSETQKAIKDGATEIDMVINLAAVKSNNWSAVKSDIEQITKATHNVNIAIKVIIEIGLLTQLEIEKVCEICTILVVDYVKTSTGIIGKPVTLEDVKLLRTLLPQSIKIKASAGIKEKAFASQLIEAGANRLGTSSGIKLIQ